MIKFFLRLFIYISPLMVVGDEALDQATEEKRQEQHIEDQRLEEKRVEQQIQDQRLLQKRLDDRRAEQRRLDNQRYNR